MEEYGLHDNSPTIFMYSSVKALDCKTLRFESQFLVAESYVFVFVFVFVFLSHYKTRIYLQNSSVYCVYNICHVWQNNLKNQYKAQALHDINDLDIPSIRSHCCNKFITWTYIYLQCCSDFYHQSYSWCK